MLVKENSKDTRLAGRRLDAEAKQKDQKAFSRGATGACGQGLPLELLVPIPQLHLQLRSVWRPLGLRELLGQHRHSSPCFPIQCQCLRGVAQLLPQHKHPATVRFPFCNWLVMNWMCG